MKYRIEPLTENNLDHVIHYFIIIDADTIGERWAVENFALDLPGKWRCSWYAARNGRPVGFVIASIKGDSIHVHRIAVDATVRGAGIGRALLLKTAESAKHEGIRWITLRVASGNVGAIRFYNRLGFEREGAASSLLDLRIAADDLLNAVPT